jgi:histidinol dehydrogenase
VRLFTVQRLTRRGLAGIAPSVVTLAEAEGLTAHAASVRVRR